MLEFENECERLGLEYSRIYKASRDRVEMGKDAYYTIFLAGRAFKRKHPAMKHILLLKPLHHEEYSSGFAYPVVFIGMPE
jgi:hypothetical protein